VHGRTAVNKQRIEIPGKNRAKQRRRSRALGLENDGHGENHGEELPEIHFHTLQFLAEYTPPCTGSTSSNAGATHRSTERPLGASASLCLEIKAKSYPVRHSTSPVLAVAAGTQTPTRSLARSLSLPLARGRRGGRWTAEGRRQTELRGWLPSLPEISCCSVRLRISDRRWVESALSLA
jgi:hypothetical protein